MARELRDVFTIREKGSISIEHAKRTRNKMDKVVSRMIRMLKNKGRINKAPVSLFPG